MEKVLSVYLYGQKIGQLIQNAHGHLTFCYAQNYLNQEKPVPLSVALPLQREPFADQAVRAFFSGLLPDDYLRKILAQNLGVSAENTFSLLWEVGGDCAGAVELYPSHLKLPPIDENYYFLSAEELADILAKLPTRPLLAGNDKMRLSLAGAQSKIALFYDEEKGKFAFVNSQPSTHILKPAIPNIPNSVENELFCMRLAALMNLDVPHVAAHHVQNIPYLLVSRYDRYKNNEGKINRIHQEDFCQALSIPPELKYQREGGPGIATCLALIERYSVRPAVDYWRFIRVIIFNYLIGNADAHGKNYSLLHEPIGIHLAPFYDLLSTAIYPDLDQKMAMKIGNTYKPHEINLRAWHRVLANTATTQSMMNKELQKLANNLPNAADQIEKNLFKEGIISPVFEEIKKIIHERCSEILALF